jgi:hypothetical protein
LLLYLISREELTSNDLSERYLPFAGGQGQYSAAIDKHLPQMPDRFNIDAPYHGLSTYGEDDSCERLIRLADKVRRLIQKRGEGEHCLNRKTGHGVLIFFEIF